jgi:hypothetical protein
MKPGRVLLALVILLGVSAFTASMLMVIYPGSFKLTAPLLCPADQPDPFVVRYTYQTSDGTSTNFTLFCMGERGQFTEVGTWAPFALLAGFATGGLAAVAGILAVLAHVSRHHRPDLPADAPADAPVDAPIVDPPVP